MIECKTHPHLRQAAKNISNVIRVSLCSFFMTNCAASAQEINVDYRPLMNTFPLHGPILVEVTFVNRGAESKKIELGADRREAFEFHVVDPEGQAATTVWRHESGVFDPGDFQLGPDSAYSQVIVLSDWYDFDKVGDYKVSASVSPLANRKTDPAVFRKEFVIRVEENPDSLVSLCSELATQATDTDIGVAGMAARALSYVDDPACLPYMERALEEGRPLAGILKGLGRIATPEAVDILERVLRKRDLSTYQAAAQALREVIERTEDERLRRRIEHLIENVPQPEVRIAPPVL